MVMNELVSMLNSPREGLRYLPQSGRCQKRRPQARKHPSHACTPFPAGLDPSAMQGLATLSPNDMCCYRKMFRGWGGGGARPAAPKSGFPTSHPVYHARPTTPQAVAACSVTASLSLQIDDDTVEEIRKLIQKEVLRVFEGSESGAPLCPIRVLQPFADLLLTHCSVSQSCGPVRPHRQRPQLPSSQHRAATGRQGPRGPQASPAMMAPRGPQDNLAPQVGRQPKPRCCAPPLWPCSLTE